MVKTLLVMISAGIFAFFFFFFFLAMFRNVHFDGFLHRRWTCTGSCDSEKFVAMPSDRDSDSLSATVTVAVGLRDDSNDSDDELLDADGCFGCNAAAVVTFRLHCQISV
jgi:hypothetical protein